jgi:hypothetical protein
VRGGRSATCLRVLITIIELCMRRRENLPLTCRAFAAACDDLIWDSLNVDPWQYKEQTSASMAWERVLPWLMKRARTGNISGIVLRWVAGTSQGMHAY